MMDSTGDGLAHVHHGVSHPRLDVLGTVLVVVRPPFLLPVAHRPQNQCWPDSRQGSTARPKMTNAQVGQSLEMASGERLGQ